MLLVHLGMMGIMQVFEDAVLIAPCVRLQHKVGMVHWIAGSFEGQLQVKQGKNLGAASSGAHQLAGPCS